MKLKGKNIIGGRFSAKGRKKIIAFDPKAGKKLPLVFFQATIDEIHRSLDLADKNRKPAPEPDIRQFNIPLGPVRSG